MTIPQKMYIFYKRHFGVRKPDTDKFYYPKLFLYRVLKFLGFHRIKASMTRSTVKVGTFAIKVDRYDSLNLIMNPKADPTELAIVTSTLKPGDTAIDVGANIGLYTLYMAQSVGLSGKVFAFEPEPENFALLNFNVAGNKFDNVTLYQCAASNARSTAALAINDKNMGMHRLSTHPGSADSIEVETVRVDDLIDSRIDVRLAKIDVEGHELHVLEGMANLLSRNTHIHLLVEYNPSSLIAGGTQPGQLLDCLKDFGFVMEVAGRSGRVSSRVLLENFSMDGPAYANLHCYRP